MRIHIHSKRTENKEEGKELERKKRSFCYFHPYYCRLLIFNFFSPRLRERFLESEINSLLLDIFSIEHIS